MKIKIDMPSEAPTGIRGNGRPDTITNYKYKPRKQLNPGQYKATRININTNRLHTVIVDLSVFDVNIKLYAFSTFSY
jgi:hypothetical protein